MRLELPVAQLIDALQIGITKHISQSSGACVRLRQLLLYHQVPIDLGHTASRSNKDCCEDIKYAKDSEGHIESEEDDVKKS